MTNLNCIATLASINIRTEHGLGADFTLTMPDLTDEQLGELLGLVQMPVVVRLEALEGPQPTEGMPSHQPVTVRARKAKNDRRTWAH